MTIRVDNLLKSFIIYPNRDVNRALVSIENRNTNPEAGLRNSEPTRLVICSRRIGNETMMEAAIRKTAISNPSWIL